MILNNKQKNSIVYFLLFLAGMTALILYVAGVHIPEEKEIAPFIEEGERR